jgi:hypothetical protein
VGDRNSARSRHRVMMKAKGRGIQRETTMNSGLSPGSNLVEKIR